MGLERFAQMCQDLPDRTLIRNERNQPDVAPAPRALQRKFLRSLLPVMLTLALVYTLLSKNLGQTHAPKYTATTEAILASLISLLLGLYDGFFGPGTGSFFIFLFVRVLGFDFLHAVASAKVLNMTTNLAALALFGWAGHVWWQFMIPMAVANVVGSHLGARLTLSRGSGFIRLVFIAVVAALILKSVVPGQAFQQTVQPPAPERETQRFGGATLES